MSDNPEEGRYTPESFKEALTESRRTTAEMKREYRAQRNKKAAMEKAKRYVERHKPAHEAIQEDMRRVSYGRQPLNRRGRRSFAKKINAFKTPMGWKNFNKNYATQYGFMESHSRGARARKDAAKAAKSNNNNSIATAMKEGAK
jgi:hypothetical protein